MNRVLKKQTLLSLLFIFISLFLFALIPACSKESSDRSKTKEHKIEVKAEKGAFQESRSEVSTTLKEMEKQRVIQETENTPPVIKDAKLVLDVDGDRPVLRVEAQAADPDGDDVEMEYKWYRNGEEAGDGERFYEFRGGDSILVRVRAFDGQDYSSERRLSIDIRNTPPRVVNDNSFDFDGKTVTKQIKATDPDGDSLVYRLIKAPDGAKLNEQSGLFKWVVPDDFKGNTPVEISVEDGQGGKTIYKFVITIKEEAERKPVKQE